MPQLAQRLGQCLRVAARYEHPVDAVAHDVAIAGDVRRDDRSAGRERLGQHHAEALSAQRRGAQHVGLAPARGASRPRRPCPAPGRRARPSSAARAPRGSGRSRSARWGCARAAPRRRAAAAAAPCARRPGRRTRSAGSRGRPHRSARPWPARVRPRTPRGPGIDVDAVGDHAVVAAEPAPSRPGRGLGDGDPHVQAVQHPAGADQVGDPVRDAVVGVGVERADQRQAGRVGRHPAGQRCDRLVDVDHVVAARAELLVQRARSRTG